MRENQTVSLEGHVTFLHRNVSILLHLATQKRYFINTNISDLPMKHFFGLAKKSLLAENISLQKVGLINNWYELSRFFGVVSSNAI